MPKPPHATVRDRLEAKEALLSPFAARSATTRGRERPEPPSPVRTQYQRDRDRILHSNAFRRLKHKTQVFIAPSGDHYVTRLTHTLEVAQIARTIARALNLNEDLAEAAALGHDIGHAPFGHAGEEALARRLPDSFRHNIQSVRVVELLESGPGVGHAGPGLNLTWEVRDAILKSSKTRDDILAEAWGVPETLEGQIVKLADAIAYLNHDIGDAIRAGLLREDDLPAKARDTLGRSHRQRIDTLVRDIIDSSWAATGLVPAETAPAIAMSPPVHEAANALREFMFANLYERPSVQREAQRATRLVQALFDYYVSHTDEIVSDYALAGDPPQRRAADYVSGMTDLYALRRAEELGLTDLPSRYFHGEP